MLLMASANFVFKDNRDKHHQKSDNRICTHIPMFIFVKGLSEAKGRLMNIEFRAL